MARSSCSVSSALWLKAMVPPAAGAHPHRAAGRPRRPVLGPRLATWADSRTAKEPPALSATGAPVLGSRILRPHQAPSRLLLMRLLLLRQLLLPPVLLQMLARVRPGPVQLGSSMSLGGPTTGGRLLGSAVVQCKWTMGQGGSTIGCRITSSREWLAQAPTHLVLMATPGTPVFRMALSGASATARRITRCRTTSRRATASAGLRMTGWRAGLGRGSATSGLWTTSAPVPLRTMLLAPTAITRTLLCRAA
mmetsp:Transcript_66917/g.217706  ORF Transcript_66917/g.217706 Transcript_66917/m.217706 type:complete len:250 (+) Transcript_66917:320-1069(+)